MDEEAINTLKYLYVETKNEVFARHLRARWVFRSVYLLSLKQLSKDFNFKAVTAEQNKDDYIRDSFISGLLPPNIR